jgi:hypothetical protein
VARRHHALCRIATHRSRCRRRCGGAWLPWCDDAASEYPNSWQVCAVARIAIQRQRGAWGPPGAIGAQSTLLAGPGRHVAHTAACMASTERGRKPEPRSGFNGGCPRSRRGCSRGEEAVRTTKPNIRLWPDFQFAVDPDRSRSPGRVCSAGTFGGERMLPTLWGPLPQLPEAPPCRVRERSIRAREFALRS